ncbi:ATP-binding protein [Paenibacillus sp. FSL R10-2748]
MHIPISQITEADLQNLITNSVSESRFLDYKEQLHIQQQSEKKEFLSDISAFANSGGGEMIFGVSETGGQAVSINGIPVTDPDALKLQIENIIRTGIAPRIYGLQTEIIKLTNGNSAVVIRIPQSLNGPHMVTLSGSQIFTIRNSAVKHPMSVSEIRSAFIANNALREQTRNFCMERLAAIKLNEGTLDSGVQLVLHVIPLSSFGDSMLSTEVLDSPKFYLRDFDTTGGDYRFNLDGVYQYAKWQAFEQACRLYSVVPQWTN